MPASSRSKADWLNGKTRGIAQKGVNKATVTFTLMQVERQILPLVWARVDSPVRLWVERGAFHMILREI
jgi:hypothetical protein